MALKAIEQKFEQFMHKIVERRQKRNEFKVLYNNRRRRRRRRRRATRITGSAKNIGRMKGNDFPQKIKDSSNRKIERNLFKISNREEFKKQRKKKVEAQFDQMKGVGFRLQIEMIIGSRSYQ